MIARNDGLTRGAAGIRPSRRRSFPRFSLIAAITSSLFASAASAAPTVDLHDLTWYVHIDLIDAGAGEDLAFWQATIDEEVARANELMEGTQGPFDSPCCTRFTRSASVVTFGTTGDGLDVVDSAADQNAIAATGGAGSSAFLVDSMTWCGGSNPPAIGCALTPTCDGDGSDDPTLWMTVTVDAFDSETLSAVIAHERGHNACLPHVAAAECQIMQGSISSPGLGSCLSTSECTNMQAGRTTTSSGLSCGCLDDVGGIEADGFACTEVAGGICSGGLCGDAAGDAGVHLIGSAAPGTASGGVTDDSIVISALKGDWSTIAQFSGGSDEIDGLAYASDSSTLYGVIATSGDDSVVTVDPDAGTIIATVGTIANGTDEMIGLAYDPGASSMPSDDRLLVMELTGGAGSAEIRSIDPATPSTTTLLGSMLLSPANFFTGLAYDSINEKLYAATPFTSSMFEIDLTTCPPSPCTTTGISGTPWSLFDASLTFSADTGMLYLAGTQFGGTRTFYNVIDPNTWTSAETVSLDVFRPGGLAAVPAVAAPVVPAMSPAGLALLGAALGALGLRMHARRAKRGG